MNGSYEREAISRRYSNNEKSIQPYPSPEFLNSLSFIKKFYPLPFGAREKFPKVTHENSSNSRHSELIAKESSLLQYKAAAKNENNSTETLNGATPPNRNGEDQFEIFFTKEKLVPAGIKGAIYTFERACNRTIKSPYPSYDGGVNMYACTAWVLYNENQDYLHCDDLSWDGKHFCKDK